MIYSTLCLLGASMLCGLAVGYWGSVVEEIRDEGAFETLAGRIAWLLFAIPVSLLLSAGVIALVVVAITAPWNG